MREERRERSRSDESVATVFSAGGPKPLGALPNGA